MKPQLSESVRFFGFDSHSLVPQLSSSLGSASNFPADQSTASWLLNAAYAADWQAFQSSGSVGPK